MDGIFLSLCYCAGLPNKNILANIQTTQEQNTIAHNAIF